jgi:hypothetical protein
VPQGKNIPKEVEKAMIIPIIKPGKEGSDEVSKFRPISLLDLGGKVLEIILINRINHHVYSQGHMNKTQFGFRPQKAPSTRQWQLKTWPGSWRSNSASKL